MQKNSNSLYVRLLILLIAFVVSGCGGSTTIYHGLDERDANDIIVYLDNQGIKAYKVASTEGGGGGQQSVLWDISVSQEHEKQAMALLRAAGLPRRAGQNLLDIFQKGGLVPSEMEEKIRYQAGLGAQIASTIRKIDGVLDADVQLSFPEEDPLNPDKPKGDVKASVYVKHTGVLDDPNTQLPTRIRRLVASAIQGLDFDNVTVIPDRARYADLSLRESLAQKEADKEFVRVWTLVVAKESARRFQILFFSFLVFILLLLLALAWTLWKTYPLFASEGGMKSLFSPHQFHAESKEPAAEEGNEEKKEEKDEEDEGVT